MDKSHSPTTVAEIENDLDLLKQSATDPEAFRPVYEKYFKKIFAFVRHRVGDKMTAADITQQVFLKAWMGLSKFQFKGLPFSSWLYRIAINECNDYFRRTKKIRYVALEDADISHLFEELTAEPSLEQLHVKLPDILQKLLPDELHFIELRYFEKRSFKEIGEIFGITDVNARVKTYRILEKMKKHFHEN